MKLAIGLLEEAASRLEDAQDDANALDLKELDTALSLLRKIQQAGESGELLGIRNLVSISDIEYYLEFATATALLQERLDLACDVFGRSEDASDAFYAEMTWVANIRQWAISINNILVWHPENQSGPPDVEICWRMFIDETRDTHAAHKWEEARRAKH